MKFIILKKAAQAALSSIPILLSGLIASLSLTPQANAATTYIFATFDGNGASEQELWIYTSSDGSNWSPYCDTNYRGPTGVLRDPSIIKNPADGKYYVAYTAYSYNTQSTYFNIASSSDLKNWTHVTSVDSGVSGTKYTWAPEFFMEGSAIRIIASLSPSNSPWSFVAYYYTAQNTSLTSWSGPTRMQGIGPNVIDTYVVKSGSTYHAFTQNGNTLYLEHATATSMAGPWTYIATGNWAGWGTHKEGPCLFQLDNGTWTLFADWYTNNGINKATSSNLTSWSTPFTSVTSLSSKRHGTVWRETSTLPTSLPAAGTYKVQCRTNGIMLDSYGRTAAGDSCAIYLTDSGHVNQTWTLSYVGSNVVNLRAVGGGLYLDGGGLTANGSTCKLWTASTSNNLRWTLIPTSGDYYKLKNVATGQCVDVGASPWANGDNCEQWGEGSSTNQQWRFIAP